MNFYDRQAPGALLEPRRKEFGFSDSKIGLLGSLFVWVYALADLPLGRLADRWSRKQLLTLGLTAWSALTAFSGLATTFSVLLLTRLGLGVGEAVCGPVETSWIGDLFPPGRRAGVLSIFMLGVPVGGLEFSAVRRDRATLGWRAALVSAAAPALLLIPLLLTVPEPVRGAFEPGAAKSRGGSVRELLRIPTLWWIIASGALFNFNMYALATFLPAFMTRVHGYSVARAGATSGIVYRAGGVLGGLLGGYLDDLVPSPTRQRRLSAAAAVALRSAPVMFLGIRQTAGAAAAAFVCIGVAYAAFNTYYGFLYSSIQDIVASYQRAFAMSVYFLAMYLCGASFGPLVTGSLSDLLARRAMHAHSAGQLEAFRGVGLQQAMLIMPALSIALALVLYAGSRTMAADVRRNEAGMPADDELALRRC